VSVGVLWRPSTARAAFHGFDRTGCPTTGRIWEILELDTWRRSGATRQRVVLASPVTAGNKLLLLLLPPSAPLVARASMEAQRG
jgi:hypothetical protein